MKISDDDYKKGILFMLKVVAGLLCLGFVVAWLVATDDPQSPPIPDCASRDALINCVPTDEAG